MYTVADYGRMFTDEVRMRAYVEALTRHVRPGSVVVDLGAGTGILSLIACKLGARKVYAIETNDAIQLLPATARENGVADRICVLQQMSTEITLPERADVLVSDLRGVLPTLGNHLPSIVDARARLLAPGGVLLPQRDTLRAALVDAPALYERVVSPWASAPFGLSMAAARASAVNSIHADRDMPLRREQQVTEARTWAILDYATLTSPSIAGRASFRVERPATSHGVALWFDAAIDDQATYSNAPGTELIYSRMFLPFPEPVALAVGEEVALDLVAQFNGVDYTWGWTTRVTPEGAPHPRLHHRQSTFLGNPASVDQLRREHGSRRPRLDPAGEAERDILLGMDGGSTIAELSQRAFAEHPETFRSEVQALAAVRRLARRYAR